MLESDILDLQHNSLYGILIVSVPLGMYMLQCHLVKPEHRYSVPNLSFFRQDCQQVLTELWAV